MASIQDSNLADPGSPRATPTNKTLNALFVSSAVYAFACLSIFWPHLANFGLLDFLLPAALILAAIGAFLFARSFCSAFAAFMCGLLYAFSPYLLSLAAFHPLVPLLAATVPWLLWLGFSPQYPFATVRQPLAVCMISALLIAFFNLANSGSFYPLPLHAGPEPESIIDLLAWPVEHARLFSFNLYHLGSLLATYGLFRHLLNQPPLLVIIAGMALVLAFSAPVFTVAPAAWGILPTSLLCLLAAKSFDNLAKKRSRSTYARLLSLTIVIPLAISALANLPALIDHRNQILWLTVSTASAVTLVIRTYTGKPQASFVIPILLTVVSADTVCNAMLLIDTILKN